MRETDRIGSGPSGFVDIQTHGWFAGLDWPSLLRKRMPAPWFPRLSPDGVPVDVHIPGFTSDEIMVRRPHASLSIYIYSYLAIYSI